jgi:hypothetical protein|tara:strand:- start:12163 stop:12486 length:324 start_codon:yes stop_codon:yes gene_type:complete
MSSTNGQKPPAFYQGGSITFNTPASTTIAATTTAAIPANINRKYLTVTNDSDEVMYLAWGNAAVMNKGIRLNAAGGSESFIGPSIFQAALNAICASGTKVLIYQEGE